jgi:hypothetical protein
VSAASLRCSIEARARFEEICGRLDTCCSSQMSRMKVLVRRVGDGLKVLDFNSQVLQGRGRQREHRLPPSCDPAAQARRPYSLLPPFSASSVDRYAGRRVRDGRAAIAVLFLTRAQVDLMSRVGRQWLVPLPLRVTVWGLPVALSVTARVPLRLPTLVGLKVIEILQPAPGCTELAQLLVWGKSTLVLILEMVKRPNPVFVSFTVCAGLVVPTT